MPYYILATMQFRDIAVLIPAYNVENTIRKLIRQLLTMGFHEKSIIIINDGSHDATGQIAREERVTLCEHERNRGKGMALRTGIKCAQVMGKKKIMTMDADGQHDPGDINVFMECKDEYDLIIGQRSERFDMPVLRRLVNRITSLVVSLLSGQQVPDVQCGFRMIDLRIFHHLSLMTTNYQTESELVIKAARQGFKIGSVSVATLYKNEKSHIRPFLDTARFIDMAVRFLWV